MTTMISSAVVIPESEEPRPRNGSASPALKRKLSQTLDHDRKRPRVDTDADTLNYDEAKQTSPPAPSSAPSQPKPAIATPSATSPANRRSSALGSVVEEKKRSQRLFGGLLGVVSGSATRSNPAYKKRDEIEARARERLKRENEEQEEARKRRRAQLEQRRRSQQKSWEEESVRLRHQNMRNMAAFLTTKSDPPLYYKPWELRPEEEDIIERQKRQVEDQIQRELGRNVSEDSPATSDRQWTSHPGEEVPTKKEKTAGGTAGLEPTNIKEQRDGPVEEGGEKLSLDGGNNSRTQSSSDDCESDKPPVTDGLADSNKDDDPHDGELVEGQEDDVIY